MLKLKNITKDYKIVSGNVHALKGVSLDFRKSEFVCILGQSGCGKTTLLNIIGGLDHYTSGDLVIQGKSTKDFTDRDWDVYRNHRIGFIFQSYNLIPHQTVLGNVELALTIAGIGKEERKRRAISALERVGLGDELNKRPNQLSGGQCQRVAIARALVNEPDILLADEPTGALDSATSVQIMDLIKEIAGERLVIMVTHNPELAETYASRIVRLHDGLVESDSNPYTEEEEEFSVPQEESVAAETSAADGKKKKSKKLRARMSFLTSLALSARNLLTKKGRTIVTSVAGSIGIISVCLVLALSSGFNSYIKRTEEDMLSYYPVEISESAFDITSAMMSFTAPQDMPDMSELQDKIYVDSFLTSLASGISVTNDISENYLDYVSKMDESWYSEVQYNYGATITDNLFTAVTTGIPATSEFEGRGEKTEYLSLSQLKVQYIADLNEFASEYSNLVPFSNFFSNIVKKMPGTSDPADTEHYGKYVLSQYDVVGGNFPTGANEALLVVGNNNEVSDLTLAQLGILKEPDFLKLFKLGKDEETTTVEETSSEINKMKFSEIIGKEYVFFGNDAVYTENDNYDPMEKDSFAFTYKGSRSSLSTQDAAGVPIKISGIARLKEGLTYGCLQSGLNITERAVLDYIKINQESRIIKWMQSDEGKITGKNLWESLKTQYPFLAGKFTDAQAIAYLNTEYLDKASFCRAPSAKLSGNYTAEYVREINLGSGLPPIQLKFYHINVSHTAAIRAAGGSDTVAGVYIYATDFDGKDAMLSYLDAWNDLCENGGSYNDAKLSEAQKVTYTDRVGLLMGMVQTMLDVITYVLVAFTAISLVVSSVMIGIITYVSVVERIKEIGVLRSLGARKKDIRNLFNAETFIIGLAAGLIGIFITYLLSFMISAIIYSLAGIAGIASLPPLTAVIMVLVSIALTLVSGLIPAQAAARKDPVIALRTE